jgi:hypothetical protein
LNLRIFRFAGDVIPAKAGTTCSPDALKEHSAGKKKMKSAAGGAATTWN